MTDLTSLAQNGFARVRATFSSEELELADRETRTLINGWMRGDHADADFWTWRPPNQPSSILYRIHNLERRSPAVAQLIRVGKLPRLAETVLGAPCRATACALTLKLEGCGLAVPWHRDPISAPPQTVYNFSIYLDQSDATNGALEAIPSSHLQPNMDWSDENTPPLATRLDAKPGDILIHDVKLLHGSPACRGNRQRRAIVVEYQRVADELTN